MRRTLNRRNPISNHPSNKGLIGWWLALPGWASGVRYWDLTQYRNHAIIYPYAPYSGSYNNGLDGTSTLFGALTADGVRSGGYGICHGADVQVLNGVPTLAQNKPLTISAWIRNTTSNDAQFLTVDDSGGTPTAYNSNGNGFGLRYYKTQNQSNGIAYVNAPCGGTPGPWHYLFTQDAGNMYMYANGILYNTVASISSFSNPINRVWFGRNTFTNGGEGMYAGDQVGDVRIRAGAVTKAEAAFLYQERIKGYPNLLNWITTVSFARPATSSTITGTASTTAGTTTVSTGTLTIAGTASTTAGTTSSSTGTLTVDGSAVTTAGTTTTGVGAVRISATASTTAGTTTASTGTLTVGATANTTAGTTTTSTGAVTITGSASTTAGTTTVSTGSTTGAVGAIHGTADTTAGTITTSTGTVTVTGSATSSAGTTSTSTGTVRVAGTASTTASTVTTSTGAVRITATASTTASTVTTSTGTTGGAPTPATTQVHLFLLGA